MAFPPVNYTQTSTKVQGHLDGIDAALGNALDSTSLRTLTGTTAGSNDFGTVFTGTTIPNATTVVGALQALETAVEAATGTTNLGTAAIGATTLDITSSTGAAVTVPAATGTTAGVMPSADKVKTDFLTVTGAINLDTVNTQQGNLITLSGVAANAANLGTFTGSTITDGSATVKSALQELETAVEAVPSRVQTVVANIAARDALTGNTLGDLVFTTDASADPTITSGGALYIWDGAAWQKVAEGESLDVSTNLGTAAIGATTLDITSSTGAAVTVPAATNAAAGVMPAADKAKVDFIAVTQAVDLDAMETTQTTLNTQQGNLITLSGQPAGTTALPDFTGTTITTGATITSALQELETAVEGVTSTTNLAIGTVDATTVQVTSDTGTDATIPAATGVAAGVMPAADKVKTDFISVAQAVDLDAMETEQGNIRTLTGTAANATDFGTTFTGATIPNASTVVGALQALETAVEAVPTKRQSVVANNTARDALTGQQAGDVAYVQDASADATVVSGAAMYIWDGAAWQKISEFESLDVQTDLGTANITVTGLDVTSSTGNATTLPAATNAAAGVATAAQIADLEDIVTLSGVAGNSANLGTTITGNIVQNNRTIAQAIQDLVNYFTPTQATSAQLNAVADAINTTGKHLGRPVYNTTLDVFVWASGPAAADTWIDGAGLVQNTPV